MRLRWLLACLTLCLFLGIADGARAQSPSRFSDWTVGIVAGDWRSSDGAPIQAFDNAVRDLAIGFAKVGFDPDNIVSLTLRPDAAEPVTAIQAAERIGAVAEQAQGGCLFYLTSHGSRRGAVFGPDVVLTPEMLARLIDGWCTGRPTVVVVSACFSGVFVEAIEGPNRIVMTSARRDRSSFGCSEEATYPYFDGCILEALPQAADFIALAQRAGVCVTRREANEGLSPASEPQVSIGSEMQLRGATLRFDHVAIPDDPPG